jgi:hypothetical protein
MMTKFMHIDSSFSNTIMYMCCTIISILSLLLVLAGEFIHSLAFHFFIAHFKFELISPNDSIHHYQPLVIYLEFKRFFIGL